MQTFIVPRNQVVQAHNPHLSVIINGQPAMLTGHLFALRQIAAHDLVVFTRDLPSIPPVLGRPTFTVRGASFRFPAAPYTK